VYGCQKYTSGKDDNDMLNCFHILGSSDLYSSFSPTLVRKYISFQKYNFTLIKPNLNIRRYILSIGLPSFSACMFLAKGYASVILTSCNFLETKQRSYLILYSQVTPLFTSIKFQMKSNLILNRFHPKCISTFHPVNQFR